MVAEGMHSSLQLTPLLDGKLCAAPLARVHHDVGLARDEADDRDVAARQLKDRNGEHGGIAADAYGAKVTPSPAAKAHGKWRARRCLLAKIDHQMDELNQAWLVKKLRLFQELAAMLVEPCGKHSVLTHGTVRDVETEIGFLKQANPHLEY